MSAETLKSVHEETLRLSHLIDTLRELEIIESGELSFSPEGIDLRETIRKAISLFTVASTQKNITLDFVTVQRNAVRRERRLCPHRRGYIQSYIERDQIHAAGRKNYRARGKRHRRLRELQRGGFGPRHRAGRASARIRAVLPRRQIEVYRIRGQGTRARDRVGNRESSPGHYNRGRLRSWRSKFHRDPPALPRIRGLTQPSDQAKNTACASSIHTAFTLPRYSIGMSNQHGILYIDGMTCSSCESRISRTLASLSGVISSKVSLRGGTAEIEWDDSKITFDGIKAAIGKTGYTVRANKGSGTAIALGIGLLLVAAYLIAGSSGLFAYIPRVDATIGYAMLFAIGILTSIHCVAMCGGIALSAKSGRGADSLRFGSRERCERRPLTAKNFHSRPLQANSARDQIQCGPGPCIHHNRGNRRSGGIGIQFFANGQRHNRGSGRSSHDRSGAPDARAFPLLPSRSSSLSETSARCRYQNHGDAWKRRPFRRRASQRTHALRPLTNNATLRARNRKRPWGSAFNVDFFSRNGPPPLFVRYKPRHFCRERWFQ